MFDIWCLSEIPTLKHLAVVFTGSYVRDSSSAGRRDFL